MRTLLLSITLLLTLQASDCATADSVQDSNVTAAKREVDAEDAKPTPMPIVMREVYSASSSASSDDDLPPTDSRLQREYYLPLDCYLPENPTASQMEAYLRKCVAKDRKKTAQAPKRPSVEGGQR